MNWITVLPTPRSGTQNKAITQKELPAKEYDTRPAKGRVEKRSLTNNSLIWRTIALRGAVGCKCAPRKIWLKYNRRKFFASLFRVESFLQYSGSESISGNQGLCGQTIYVSLEIHKPMTKLVSENKNRQCYW